MTFHSFVCVRVLRENLRNMSDIGISKDKLYGFHRFIFIYREKLRKFEPFFNSNELNGIY
jgi:hypothetical protein